MGEINVNVTQEMVDSRLIALMKTWNYNREIEMLALYSAAVENNQFKARNY